MYGTKKEKQLSKGIERAQQKMLNSWLVTVWSEKYIITNKAHDCRSRKTTECELSNDSIIANLCFEFESISKIITLPCPKTVDILVINFES